MKLFSIVIPTKGRPSLIERLLYTIEIQKFYDIEIIISDCSGEEDTHNIVKKSNLFKLIKYIKNPKLSMSENWNSAISIIDGEFIIFLSDKCLLKKGSLNYLENKIRQSKYEVITWNLDSFYLNTNSIKFNNRYKNSEIKSKDMLTSILESNIKEFDKSPFYGNSCVRNSVYERIITKHKKISFDVNPDYTMTMQILLNIDSFEVISENLTLLQFPDYYSSWGGGHNYTINKSLDILNNDAYKLNERKAYLKYYYIENPMILINLILADVIYIFEKYDINIYQYTTKQKILENYAVNVINEINNRYYLGINMDEEYFNFLKFFIINIKNMNSKIKIIIIIKIFKTSLSKIIGKIKKIKKIQIVFNKIRNYKSIKNTVLYETLENAININYIK